MMRSNGLRSAQRDACVEHQSKKGQQRSAQGVLSPLRYESVSYRRRAALG